MTQPIEELADRFEYVCELGKGGMGVVYMAQQISLNRPVAIKMLARELSSNKSLVNRFVEEARAIARMRNHPGIVEVYDYLKTEDNFYIVMEFVDGEALNDVLRSRKCLPMHEALELVVSVSQAIGHAHAAGVVHRDIKPENIMVLPGNRVKVMDFGIAHLTDSTNLTRTGTVLGTPRYMSPEQAGGKSVDRRSDIYALGVLLFQLTTAKLPFDADTAIALAMMHINEIPPPPRKINPAISIRLEKLILKALEKNPDDRFPGTEEMILELEKVIEDIETLGGTTAPNNATQIMDDFDPNAVLNPFAQTQHKSEKTLESSSALPEYQSSAQNKNEPQADSKPIEEPAMSVPATALIAADWIVAAALMVVGFFTAWKIF